MRHFVQLDEYERKYIPNLEVNYLMYKNKLNYLPLDFFLHSLISFSIVFTCLLTYLSMENLIVNRQTDLEIVLMSTYSGPNLKRCGMSIGIPSSGPPKLLPYGTHFFVRRTGLFFFFSASEVLLTFHLIISLTGSFGHIELLHLSIQ